MTGNVMEWCRDTFGFFDKHARQNDGEAMLLVPVGDDQERVCRGGGWGSIQLPARSAGRYYTRSTTLHNDLGVRFGSCAIRD